MFRFHRYFDSSRASRFGLDPETPATDYEIHFVRTTDPGYIPPDSEAWPLYYHAAIDVLKTFPEAYNAVCDAVTLLCNKLEGRRALPPQPIHSPRLPNEANPLPVFPDLGKRTFS